MEKKIVLVAFNGDAMCFVHVLLNGVDMHSKGYDVKVVIEGSATKLVEQLSNAAAPFAPLYAQVKQLGLIDCVCMACAAKMGSLEAAQAQKLPLCNEMSGHPSLAAYLDQGYEMITF